MSDHTTVSAAQYLAARGYTIGRRWRGGRGPISSTTIREWCQKGKLPGARRAGGVWLIPQEALDALLKKTH